MDILTPAKDWTSPDHEFSPDMPALQKAAVFAVVLVPFAALVAGVALFWNRGVYASDLLIALGMYTFIGWGVTVGYHRLFTHRSFETVLPVRIFLAICGSMSVQGPVVKWCAVHRRHHQVSDREGDPHSPHAHGAGVMGILKGAWHAHVGWIFEKDPEDIARSVKDLTADRPLMFIDRTFLLWVALGMLLPAAIAYLLEPTPWSAFRGFLWGGLIRLCVQHHTTWSINSVCHIWGTRPYESGDLSRNNVIFGLVSWGEGWHNNHHAFPTSARHGLRWYQFDLSWVFIRTLMLFRLAWNVRLPSEAALKAKARKKGTGTATPAPEEPVPQESVAA